MASTKLTGYYAVAETNEGYCNYYYAIYDDGNVYTVGDKILVSGANKNVLEIANILTPEEAAEKYKKNITAEVIGKVIVDISAYKKRVEKRKMIAEIKKKMDQKVKELDAEQKYNFYAEMDSEFGELYKKYKAIMEEE